jgi:hypothetical protein
MGIEWKSVRATRGASATRKCTLTKPTKVLATSALATVALFFASAAAPAGASPAASSRTAIRITSSGTGATTPPTSSTTTPTTPTMPSTSSATTPTTASTSSATAPTTAPTSSNTTPTTASTSPTTTPSSSGETTVAILPRSEQSYWLATAGGAVYAFGGAPKFGTVSRLKLVTPVVGIASTRTGAGYWLVTSGGGVYAYGAARLHGSMAGKALARPIVGMAEDLATGGYWLVSADGSVYGFDAPILGSMGGKPLQEPVVGMAAMPTARGYWLVAADGAVFNFGTARFYGSMGGKAMDAPVVGMSSSWTGHGYRLVAADGGIFDFGNAAYYGSLGGRILPHPVTAMAVMFSGKGYWITTSQGGVTSFGTAELFGVVHTPVSSRVVGMASAKGDGDPVAHSYSPGSYGYDVSKYTCGNFPTGAHMIGIVEIDSWGDTHTNPCFVTEVSWAGPGLNLYMFMLYGTSSKTEPGCTSVPVPFACDYGYIEANRDFETAQGLINSRATVPWWLDIERANWSSNKYANASVVIGAVDALHADDVATVGFYFSVYGWTTYMGTYDPSGPLFPAWWGGPPPATKCTKARSVAESNGGSMPSGPITLIQYTDNVHGYDGDYAC